LRRRAQLLLGELRGWTFGRFYLGVAALVCVTAALGAEPQPFRTAALAVAGAVRLIAGELIERHLFFLAAPSPRMPGESP
ncbi:MAG TPA: hypothetical protein VML75_22440, partial [Kofleriaceae bacterium]|nr:hypothetical protein [Kofleriaceae bacterium]